MRPTITDFVSFFRDLDSRLQDLSMELKDALLQATPVMRGGSMNTVDMCDVGFFLREAERKLDDLRKDAKSRRELLGQIIAARRTKEVLTDPTQELKVEGKYSTGYPDVKTVYTTPKFGTKEYVDLMRALRVPEDTIATGALKGDFNNLADLAARTEAEGRPIMPRSAGKYTQYFTTFRRKGARRDEPEEPQET